MLTIILCSIAYFIIGVLFAVIIGLKEGCWDDAGAALTIFFWPLLIILSIFLIPSFVAKRLYEFIESKRTK